MYRNGGVESVLSANYREEDCIDEWGRRIGIPEMEVPFKRSAVFSLKLHAGVN
ncbi:MAG TPA: hypothetical protein VJ720_06480 [Chitinophaga sp.]|nr:hypothetical protein [Chitinophaga sp.]